jgi:hypothetical protein
VRIWDNILKKVQGRSEGRGGCDLSCKGMGELRSSLGSCFLVNCPGIVKGKCCTGGFL